MGHRAGFAAARWGVLSMLAVAWGCSAPATGSDPAAGSSSDDTAESAGAQAPAGANRVAPRFAVGDGVCRTGLTSCGLHCVDVASDTNNCGGCGMGCSAGETCMDGACTYAPCACNEVMCGSACCGPTDQFQCVNGACQPM